MTPVQHVAMVLHGKFGQQVGLNEAEQWVPIARAAIAALPGAVSDEMKSAYGEAVYFTTDTRILPENIMRAMVSAAVEQE